MRSPEHGKEKARAQKIDPQDEETVKEKQQQVNLKIKVHSLRHQLRQMKRGNASESAPQRYEQLQKQLQNLTLQHGYGKLPLDGSILQPRCNILPSQ